MGWENEKAGGKSLIRVGGNMLGSLKKTYKTKRTML